MLPPCLVILRSKFGAPRFLSIANLPPVFSFKVILGMFIASQSMVYHIMKNVSFVKQKKKAPLNANLLP
jgi:hypothetical protein